MKKLFSPEPIYKDSIMDSTIGDSGDIFRSISLNRNNRSTEVFITLSNTGRVRPVLYRGYFDDDNKIVYHSKTYGIEEISTELRTIKLVYDPVNDYDYVTYYFTLEAIDNNTEIAIDSVGVIFERFELTRNNTKSYSVGVITDDINSNPLYEQTYDHTNSFSIIANRTDLQQVSNILEKPYYLVDVINDCIDNSSELLVENGISIAYVTGATKMVEININNIVGI